MLVDITRLAEVTDKTFLICIICRHNKLLEVGQSILAFYVNEFLSKINTFRFALAYSKLIDSYVHIYIAFYIKISAS